MKIIAALLISVCVVACDGEMSKSPSLYQQCLTENKHRPSVDVHSLCDPLMKGRL